MIAHSASDNDLLTAFLAAVRGRDLSGAADLFARMASQAAADPAFRPWRRYCEGILANERDHDLAAAERIFLEVLDHTPELEPDLAARLCIALGLTYRRQGRLAECIAACERSLPLYDRLGDPVGQAKALKQIVVAYVAGYDQAVFGSEVLPTALAHSRRALDLLAGGPQNAETRWLAGTIWNEIGSVYRNLGDMPQANAAYQRYLACSEADDYRLGIGLASGNLGEIYLNQGPAGWPAARAAFTRALTIARELHDRLHELESLVNLAYLDQQQGALDAALAGYAEAIALISALRVGISSETGRAGFFATTTETFANAILAALAADRPAHAFDLAEQARARAFLDLLNAEPDALVRRMAAETLTGEQVQAALQEDEALFAYFTTGLPEVAAGRERRQGLPRHRFPAGRTLLFVITRTALRVHDLGVAPDDLRPARLTAVVERHFLDGRLRRALYDRLLGPAADRLAGCRRLYLAPHGPLHYVPFQALIAPDGEPLLRPDGPEVIFGPSASVLFGRPGSRLADATDGEPCLALGANGSGPAALRFAEAEAHTVARLTGGRALVGPALDKATFFRLAPAARRIHISCHGEFDPQTPLASRLHLSATETLTAQEALDGLRLRCDLVTLSACESGLSRVRRGDELMGLVRAFLLAGASAVVASLWRVDERSTLLLMEHFYRGLAAGESPATALKAAQIALRSTPPYGDPFYWAPFILIGNPR